MKLALHLLAPLIGYELAVTLVVLLFPLDPLAATAAGGAVIIPILYFWYKREAVRDGEAADYMRLSLKSGGIIAGLGIGACILVNNILTLSSVITLFPGYEETADILYSPPVWEQLIAMVIVIPAVEELIFRAFAFKPLRRRLSFWPAAVVSGLIFAIYHGNMVQGIYAFILALFLAWVMERYHTLLAPYLLHFTANFVSVVMTVREGGGSTGPSWFIWVETAIALGLTAACVFLIRKNTIPRRN